MTYETYEEFESAWTKAYGGGSRDSYGKAPGDIGQAPWEPGPHRLSLDNTGPFTCDEFRHLLLLRGQVIDAQVWDGRYADDLRSEGQLGITPEGFCELSAKDVAELTSDVPRVVHHGE